MTIIPSFLLAFVLVMIPLPDWLAPYAPDWIAMVLIYWVLAQPERVGVGIGWAVGLLVDVLHANLLGVHAFGMALLAYLTYRVHLRMRMFPWWQQAVGVLLLLLIYRATTGWLRSLVAAIQLDYEYWLPCLVGMVVWPWLFVVLRDTGRPSRVQ